MEDSVRHPGTHGGDTFPCKIPLLRFSRPHHHMHMGMMPLVVVRRVPAKIIRPNTHGLRNSGALLLQQILPRGGFVVTQALRVLTPQGENKRPHFSVVSVQFGLRRLEVGGVNLAEQAMAAVLFGTGALGDIGHIAALGFHFVQMCIQRHGDKCGCCTAIGRL